MAAARDYYELLDLPRTATDMEIRSAYRRLCRSVHPDVGGSAALFGLVDDAYATLSDPIRRADYDRRLREGALARLPAPDVHARWRTALAPVAAAALALVIVVLATRGDSNSSARSNDAFTPAPSSPSTATAAAPTGSPSPLAALPPPAIPLPSCTNPCGVLHALTRRFLPGNQQKQQLLIAGTPGSSGNVGAYLIRKGANPTVLFAAPNLGPFVRFDRRRPLGNDTTGHFFFRAAGPAGPRLLVIGFEGGKPHLVGPPGGEPQRGFPNGRISRVSASGQFEITVDCTPSCAPGQSAAVYHWVDGQYRPAAPGDGF